MYRGIYNLARNISYGLYVLSKIQEPRKQPNILDQHHTIIIETISDMEIYEIHLKTRYGGGGRILPHLHFPDI